MAGQNEWGSGDWGNRKMKRSWGKNCNPVDTRRHFNVYRTSMRRQRRCIDVLKMLKRRRVFTGKGNERLRRLSQEKKLLMKTRIHWLDPRIVRKQLDILPTYHYVQNQGKQKRQTQENGQKPQFGQFFWRFQGQISPNYKFFWKKGFMQIEGHI